MLRNRTWGCVMTSIIVFALKHWRWLAGTAVLAFAGLMVHAYGRSRYNAGAASVQAKWDAASAQHQFSVEQSLANAMAAANQSSLAYQTEKTNEAERIRVVRETVTRTVTGPCLGPDSVRIVNQAISGISPVSASR